MTKTEARRLFGTWTALAEACGITLSAVSQWPEDLGVERTRKVISAAAQGGIEGVGMRIEAGGNWVEGFVDYDGRGHETNVIRLYVDNEITIGSSMCLPTVHGGAKLVLACMNEAFLKAESMLERKQ